MSVSVHHVEPYATLISLGNEFDDTATCLAAATVAIYSKEEYERIDENGEDWEGTPLAVFNLGSPEDLRALADLLEHNPENLTR